MSSLVQPMNLMRIETFRHLEPKYHSLLIKLTENYLCLVVFTFQTDQKPQFVAGLFIFLFMNLESPTRNQPETGQHIMQRSVSKVVF